MPRIEDATRVVLRPIASPVPVGMLALAVGSLMLTALQLHWVPVSNGSQVALAILTFVVPLDVVAAVFAFLARDVAMATAFSVLTGTWAAVGVLLHSAPPGSTSAVLGILTIGAAAALLVPASSAKPMPTVVLVMAAARFAVTGSYELGATPGVQTASGVIGIVLLAAALFGSTALTLEDAWHRTVPPIKRRSTGETAMSGRYADQLEELTTEAGVRQES